MSKPWQPYAQHILEAIAKIQRIISAPQSVSINQRMNRNPK
jgi:hypothetical protein